MKKLSGCLLALSVTAGSTATAANADAVAAPAERRVFAHYMTCFSASPEFYRREIMLAQHYGIDGFALNCGEWLKKAKNGKITQTRYVVNADRIFAQAKELGSGFRLFMSPDFAGSSIRTEAMLNVTDMFRRYAKHPNLFRYRGKAFYSGYSGYIEQYAPPIAELRREGYDLLLVPKASMPNYKMAWSMESLLRLFAPGSPLDGQFNFACDGTVRNIIANNALGRRATLFADKIYMAGVCPAYNSPNLRDFRGVTGYASQWQGLIDDGADLVEIVTWNDYNEDSNLTPYRWKSGPVGKPMQKPYFNRDESYLDATSYFISYYKNGLRPEITQDRIYFSYRNRSKHQVKVWNGKENRWADLRFDSWPYEQIHDDVQDCIYVTGFLTAPADLKVAVGGREHTFTLPAGIAGIEVPMQPGVPRFTLSRGDKTLIDVFGRKSIIDQVTRENSEKGYRLVNRHWTSGAVSGIPAATLEAGDVEIGSGKAVELKTPSLPAATYNFRVTYRNTGATEARLTLYSDGAPGANGAQPFYFPLFLPPTGQEFRTVSFLWTQWDSLTRFRISGDRTTDSALVADGYTDYGTAAIRRIEMIKVEPFRPQHRKCDLPALVAIPGGSFVMGSNDTEPDEAPAHQVRLSPFAIGRDEVTNAEFERFRPDHRQHRDGYSWRDREPVIYVSWKDAAGYCNWLSRRHGLTPVYDEKTFQANLAANGFRLPTEAEWEYVATGRGRNLTYPWGNAKPTRERGNFLLDRALSIDPLLANELKGGVMVVGSFPAGASPDGLMDLAGNVAEWCTDYYNLYQPGEQSNPCSQVKSHHRVIRGGSWGYYNLSQRGKDREFNNDGYPGYIYLGFRLAISAQGYEQLMRSKTPAAP